LTGAETQSCQLITWPAIVNQAAAQKPKHQLRKATNAFKQNKSLN